MGAPVLFAYSKRDRGTARVDGAGEAIRAAFPRRAVVEVPQLALRAPGSDCARLVASAEALVVLENERECVSRGVYELVREALARGLAVWVLRGGSSLPHGGRLARVAGVHLVEHLNWALTYGRLDVARDLAPIVAADDEDAHDVADCISQPRAA